MSDPEPDENTTGVPAVVFVCVKNGGKSQMAAALMRHLAGESVIVHSAGTRPGAAVNDLSDQVIAESGASMEGENPQLLTDEMLRAADRVVVLGTEAQVEPVDGMNAPIDIWDTDEPSRRGIDGEERMRLIRDDIAARVEVLLGELRAEE